MRRFDDSEYQTVPSKDGEKPKTFILQQMDADVVVAVDGHSNSPLFVEDFKSDAAFMLENKIIDRESYIEMTSPPMKDVLLRRLKLMEQREEAARKEQMQAEAAKNASKHAH